MPYDLFISYSRKDNETGRVTELKAHIDDDYRIHTGEDLHCFFDLTEINAMDDWRNRILGGLRESKLLLLVLSPAYLQSPYCEWEIVEFLKYEHSRFVQGQGVAQVYFVEISGLDTPEFEQQAAAWVARVRQRNHVDLRPWYDEGADALKRTDVRSRLEDLERSLFDRLSRLRRIADAPGNLPAHNSRFVGREFEMERLHKAAGLGQYGLLTAVQGVGGMGKTALAIQYAYAYADFYPGGRWIMGCAGMTSLAAAIRSLDSDLNIQFTDEEKLDEIRAAKRVLSVLQAKAEAGAAVRVGEKNPPSPRALLIFDNVDSPDLLQQPHTDIFSGKNWLHVIATTRLDPDKFGLDAQRHWHLAVDELPEEDAVLLIENYQPQGRFPNDAERAAAHEIARLLNGFPLAVEVVAVHLADRKGRLTCATLLDRLRKDGVDLIAGETRGTVSHVEKLVSKTLLPTLETLEADEKKILALATLLPSDYIAIPWLRSVTAKDHPELGQDSQAGYDDPWLSLINHLVGLRLLQAIEWTEDGLTPRVCRMHRLVQAVVKQWAGGLLDLLQSILMETARERGHFLAIQDGWIDRNNRWEIHSLSSFAWLAIEADLVDASFLADHAAICMEKIGDYAGAEPLQRWALEACERLLGPDHPDMLLTANNLAELLYSKGDYAGAEMLTYRVFEARERILGPDHPDTLLNMNNLAALLSCKGDYAGAESLRRRVLEARERILGPEHPDTLFSVRELASSFYNKGDYAGAESLYRRSLEARERILGPDHPDTLLSVVSLAIFLNAKGDYAGAEPLYRRGLEARERILGPEHPHTLSSMVSLASFLSDKGDYAGAEPLYRRALEARERLFGPEHPDTLSSVANLASFLRDKGDYAGAEPLYRRGLEAHERLFGPEHPDTLSSVANLASFLRDKGDYAGAEPLYRRALEARERLFGPEHPDTLSSVANLGSFLSDKGDYAGAEPLYRRALEARERLFGPEHPDTLLSVNNLCHFLSRKGDYDGAEPLQRRVLEARERLFGPEHPRTLGSLHNLSMILCYKGDNKEAIRMMEQVLKGYRRIFPADHPDILIANQDLACYLGRDGNTTAAEVLFRETLEGYERKLGYNHPDTLRTVKNLAGLLDNIGKTEEAKPLHLRYLKAQEANKDASPLMLRQLAGTYYTLGEYSEAELLIRKVLQNDFELPSSHCHLARILILTGRDNEAREEVAKAWDHRAGAPAYVLPRILWLQLALFYTLRDGTDANENAQVIIERMKTSLRREGAHMEWTMEPVLAHLKSRLPDIHHALLTVLVAALGDAKNISTLDKFAAWREAKPTTLD